MTNFRALMALLLIVPACAAQEQTPNPVPGSGAEAIVADAVLKSFEGAWRTTFGRMELHVAGNEVKGTYSPEDNGRINGTVNGSQVEFTYTETGETGKGWFELSSNGRRFKGKWQKSGGTEWKNWNGRRILPGTGTENVASANASPPGQSGAANQQEDFRIVRSPPARSARWPLSPRTLTM